MSTSDDEAAFVQAVSRLRQWALDSGLEDIDTFTVAHKDRLTKRVLKQWVFYRYTKMMMIMLDLQYILCK